MLMLVRSDARYVPLRDGCVQTCVTSPPYWGLRDYATEGQLGLEQTPDAYVANMVAVFREVRRVLRDDGTCWLNLGDSYAAHEGQRKVTDLAGPKQQTKRGSTGCPSRYVETLKAKDLVGIPWRVALALQADGWYLRSDIIWSKPNPMPESVTDRPTKAHEYVFLLAKSEQYYFDADAVAEQVTDPEYRLRGKILPTDEGRPGFEIRGGLHRQIGGGETRNIRSVWHIATQPYPGAHFATMPEKLAERCVLAGSKAGDVVLDPFVGSGTVARVALRLGRKALGLDLNHTYLELADDRTLVTYGLPFGECAV